jgi:hypothetical protein
MPPTTCAIGSLGTRPSASIATSSSAAVRSSNTQIAETVATGSGESCDARIVLGKAGGPKSAKGGN